MISLFISLKIGPVILEPAIDSIFMSVTESSANFSVVTALFLFLMYELQSFSNVEY